MATIRGHKKGIDDKALREAIDEYTTHVTTIAARAGREAMREIRDSAVMKWYKNSSAHLHMKNSTVVESDIKQKKDKIEITIKSYVNVSKFESSRAAASERDKYRSPYDNVVRWRERHEIGNRGADGKIGGTGFWTYYNFPPEITPLRPVIKMKYSIGEYLFNLPWERGIIGLPPKAKDTGTGWINPNPIVRKESLEFYVKKHLEEKWDKKVNKKFKELMK